MPSDFDSFRVVETYAKTATERGAEVPAAYEEAISHAHEIEAALSGPEHDPVPCHDDLLAANFLRDGERIWIVDWEYFGIGDRYFDLGNFAVNNDLDGDGEETPYEGGVGFCVKRDKEAGQMPRKLLAVSSCPSSCAATSQANFDRAARQARVASVADVLSSNLRRWVAIAVRIRPVRDARATRPSVD